MARLYIPFACAAFVCGITLSYVLTSDLMPAFPVATTLIGLGIAHIVGVLFGKPESLFVQDENTEASYVYNLIRDI